MVLMRVPSSQYSFVVPFVVLGLLRPDPASAWCFSVELGVSALARIAD